MIILTQEEYATVNLGNDNHRPYLEYLKERVYCEYSNGVKVSTLIKIVNKSKSTIYRYIQEIRDIIMYPKIVSEIKIAMYDNSLEDYFMHLNYSDLCLIARKIGVWGNTRKDRINRLNEYFRLYSILNIFPENTLTKDDIKRAYKRMAKRTHPDLNKNLSKMGKEFQEVHFAYTRLIKNYI